MKTDSDEHDWLAKFVPDYAQPSQTAKVHTAIALAAMMLAEMFSAGLIFGSEKDSVAAALNYIAIDPDGTRNGIVRST